MNTTSKTARTILLYLALGSAVAMVFYSCSALRLSY